MPKKTIFFLLGILLILLALSLFLGSWHLAVGEVIAILTGKESSEFNKTAVIFQVRLPRVFLAVISGAILAVSGVICQACFRNPLVDPYFLGISSGSAFGAAFGIVFNINPALPAFIGAIGAASIPLALSRTTSSILSLILLGIIVNSLFNAGLSLLKTMAEIGQLREITFWLMGSLSAGQPGDVWMLGFIFAGIFTVQYFYSARLDLIALGDTHAREQGFNPSSTRLLMLLSVAGLMAFQIKLTGIIGWIGLCTPHLVRLIWRVSTAKALLVYSALTGAILLLFCDTLIRILAQAPLWKGRILGELPISVMTSVIGALFLIIILLFYRSKGIRYES